MDEREGKLDGAGGGQSSGGRPLTRRGLIGGAALGAAGAVGARDLLGVGSTESEAKPRARNTKRVDVAVIGAGVAGLVAVVIDALARRQRQAAGRV